MESSMRELPPKRNVYKHTHTHKPTIHTKAPQHRETKRQRHQSIQRNTELLMNFVNERMSEQAGKYDSAIVLSARMIYIG